MSQPVRSCPSDCCAIYQMVKGDSTMSSTAMNRDQVTTTIQSRNWSFWLSLVLVVIGIGISGYLSYVKLTDVPMQCVQGSVFNCDAVQNSAYSRMFGIPIAYMGLATYLLIGALLLLHDRVGFLRDFGVMIEFGVILFAFLFSVWLVYVQVFILEALCVWCLAHEINMTALFVVAILRLRKALAAS